MSLPFYEGPTPWTDSNTNKFGEVFAGRVLTQQLERRMRAAEALLEGARMQINDRTATGRVDFCAAMVLEEIAEHLAAAAQMDKEANQ